MILLRIALSIAATALAGCDICDVAPSMASWCPAGLPTPASSCWCDYNADGVGDILAPSKGSACYPPPGPGVCV